LKRVLSEMKPSLERVNRRNPSVWHFAHAVGVPVAPILAALAFPPELTSQLIEQRLGVFQVGGVEALGEPAVNLSEHSTCLVAAARRCDPRCLFVVHFGATKFLQSVDGSRVETECSKPGIPCGSGCLRTTGDESPAYTNWF